MEGAREMDIARMAVVVIVSYILGLGTGMVGGVVFSFHEFAAPPGTAAVASESTPSPSKRASAEPPSDRPSEVADASPSANAPSAAPSSAVESPKVAVASPSPAPTEDERPEPSPSTASGAVAESETPSDAASGAPAPSDASKEEKEHEAEAEGGASPKAKPTPEPAAERATLAITTNKGKKPFAVYIDGAKVGVTPIVVTVAPDKTHRVKVVGGEDYSTWEEKIKPTAGEKRAVQAVLSYVPPPPPVAAPAPVYYPPARPVYVPPSGGGGGGRPGVYGNTRF